MSDNDENCVRCEHPRSQHEIEDDADDNGDSEHKTRGACEVRTCFVLDSAQDRGLDVLAPIAAVESTGNTSLSRLGDLQRRFHPRAALYS